MGQSMRDILGPDLSDSAVAISKKLMVSLEGCPGCDGIVALALVLGAYLAGMPAKDGNDYDKAVGEILKGVDTITRQVILRARLLKQETIQ